MVFHTPRQRVHSLELGVSTIQNVAHKQALAVDTPENDDAIELVVESNGFTGVTWQHC